MSSATYPLLRPRRKRRLPRVSIGRRGRIAAILVLCAAVLVGGFALLHRQAPPDARRSLLASLTTLRAGNYSAARTNAQAAIAADPGLGIAHAVLARAYLELGDGLAAEAELTRARDAGVPAARLHQLQAHARLLQGDPDGAIDEAAKATPRYAGYATRIRARALAVQGDTAAAQATLATLLDADPQDAAAWTDLGRIRISAGDVGGATQAAARAVALAPGDPAALTLQGEVLRSRYGLVAALPWFEQALARDAYYHRALIQYAATLGDAGRYADMLSATRRALQAKPGSPQALYLQAVLAARAGRTDLARGLLQHVGRTLDGLPAALLLGGSLDYADGKFEQAAATWRQLVAAQPMNVAARRLLGAALLRSGDPRAALETLRPIGVRADADGYALDLIARGFAAVGDPGVSAQFLDRANMGVGAGGPAASFATTDVVGALQAAATDAANDPTYAVGVIRGLIGSGDTAGAVARAQALVAATPGAPAAQLALGDAFAAANRYPDAATVYARAADLAFDEPTMLRLVDALGRTGRAQDAATSLALYLSQNPQSLTGQRMLGHLQVATGDWGAAIETLEGIRRRIGNRDAGLLTDLSLAYAGDNDEAVSLRYARAAYALAPMNAAAADAYGVALAANGDVAGARQLLVKATKLAPGDTAIASHLKQLG
ncbi:tetratricopeptide repeat protein [Sphingomonas ginsenosidivorax]|uniref:Tetratricopeptide repeat protein n=1 Tax=Sphingomonas ginsenosidivorax TaxID=862135 RepID=A0A5C6UHJ0_9SPHN|nr:tetratricopeptide repeat protein [Sphingomonas ginsenosidivorax]TXC71900.1 tetratricopeptide repeat protein [Sphingomonas ginsenosidivorax]